MKKILFILLFIPLFCFSQTDYDQYLPTVAWTTDISNVIYVSTDTFTVDVSPLNFGDPGAFPRIMGNYLSDNSGSRYEVIDTTSYPTITVVDVFNEGHSPYSGKIGVVYKSAGEGESHSIFTGDYSQLDDKAIGYGYKLDMSILWEQLGQPFEVVKYDTTYVSTGLEEKGTSFWDEDNNTYSFVLGNGVTGQLFEEAFIDGQNNSGSTIANGTPVSYAGSIGNSGNFRIEETLIDAAMPALYFIGLITEEVLDGNIGKILTRGKLRGITTDGSNYGETWVDSTIIYPSYLTRGYLTKTPPPAPYPAISCAIVISAHASNGTLEVRPVYPSKIVDATDVNGTPLDSTGQIMVWNNDNNYFDFDYNINDYATYPILADSVKLDTLDGSTYNSVQDWSDNIQSAGVISGGTITDGGSGTVDISLLSGILKTTNSEIGENVYFDLAATTGQTLTDETTNYISVNYNSGTPTLITTTTNTANGHTIIPLGKVFREGTDVDIINSGVRLYDFSKRVQQHHVEEAMLHFVSGAAVSEVGVRNIAITAGVLYAGLNRILTDAIDTDAGGDTFEYYYYDGTSWIESDQTQIDNIYYNDITSGLVELTSNRYTVAWTYKGDGDKAYVLYGQGNYTEAQAIESRRPSTIPDHVENFGVIRAKIIIKKSATTFFSLEQIGEGEYTSTAVNDHNELTGLNVAPYLHLTTDEYVALDTITLNTEDIVTINNQLDVVSDSLRILKERDTNQSDSIKTNYEDIAAIESSTVQSSTLLEGNTGVNNSVYISPLVLRGILELLAPFTEKDTLNKLFTKYDGDTLTVSVYDSLANHLDSILAIITRLGELVPYEGANADLNMSNYDIEGDSIRVSNLQLENGGAQIGWILTSADENGNAEWHSPVTSLIYKGAWDANTNTPTLSDATGSNGWTYAVSVGDTIDLGSGDVIFLAGGFAIHNGTAYEYIGTDATVVSVNELMGSVCLYPEIDGNLINIVGNATTIDISGATSVSTNTNNIANILDTIPIYKGVIDQNTSDISDLEAEQTIQNTAIGLNTAKTGITTAQAAAIIANTGKDTTGIFHTNRELLDVINEADTSYWGRMAQPATLLEALTGIENTKYMTAENVMNLINVYLPRDSKTETLTGDINGVNDTFTTSKNYVPETVELSINGQVAQRGLHYEESGVNTIIFKSTHLPQTDDYLTIKFKYYNY